MSPELKKRLPLFAAVLVGLALVAGGIVWWMNGQRWESTDNAFVQADTTLVMIPDAAHFVQHDARELVNRTVVDWLNARR